jgi:hypothetical protein
MTTDELERVPPEGVDLDESPFEVQAIEGLPFAKDSEEAEAIREVIEQADRDRAAQKGSEATS